MRSIEELRRSAEQMRIKTQEGSITPEEVGGLFSDLIAKLNEVWILMPRQVKKQWVSIRPTSSNGRQEVQLEVGKSYALYDAFANLRVMPPSPPEDRLNADAECIFTFHTAAFEDGSITRNSTNGNAPAITFENVSVPTDLTIETNKVYEMSFKWNAMIGKYTMLVANWDLV